MKKHTTMRLFWITLCLFFAAGSLQAQETPPPPPKAPGHECPHQKVPCIAKKHEIGIGIVNNVRSNGAIYPWLYSTMVDLWYPYPMYSYQPSLALNYRLHNPMGAYRFSVQIAYEKNERNYSSSENIDQRVSTGLNSGYEWHHNYKRLQVFYGADLFVNYQKELSEYNDTSNYDYKTENERLEFGISPLMGARYFVSPGISLGVESYVKISYYQADYSSRSAGIPYNSSGSGFKMGFAPIGMLSMGIHF
jgi:hypothetical protein